MPDSITIPYTSLEIDNTGKNIYINNESDYNSFVYLCNNLTFDNTHKKIFHITRDLSFDNSNRPDPINKFYHILDGHGFKISGIVRENEDITYSNNDDTTLNLGLIVNNNYGIIRNIILESCELSISSVTGMPNDTVDKYGVGLIVGKNYPSGIIKRCKILGDHDVTNDGVTSTIYACELTGSLEFEYVYGGICGVNNCGTIDSCVNGATITCTSNMIVGCIVGVSGNFNEEISEPGIISNSYNIGNIVFTDDPKIFGGIVGILSHIENVKNCIQMIDITPFPETTSSNFYGEIIGKVENIYNDSVTSDQLTYISNCYYINSTTNDIGIGNTDIHDDEYYNDIEVIESEENEEPEESEEDITYGSIMYGHVSRKELSDFTDPNTYDRSYNFGNIWIISDEFDEIYNVTDTPRPMLLYEISISGYEDDTDWFDPKIYKHQIKTATQIASLKTIINMSEVKNSSKTYVFEQVNDISFNGKLFTHPIGTMKNPFKDIYNGNGYKMSAIRFGGYDSINVIIQNISNESACSIFGYNYGIVENIWIYNCKVNPNNFSSTTLVNINKGNILNCKISNSTIFNKKYRIGGLCNLNDTNGCISNCLNFIGSSDETFGNIYNPDTNSHENENEPILDYIGGICSINKGKIYNSMNKCTIKAKSNGVGGICGINYGIISGCNEPKYYYDTEYVYTREYEEEIFEKQTELYSYNICTTKDNAGGICGINYGKINLCSNYYEYITASKNAGGICGMNYFRYSSSESSSIESGIISECKNGNPSINEKCGGIEPYYDENNPNEIRTNFGGICGLSYNSIIKNCYNMAKLFDSNSNAKYVGGIVGKFSGNMENCYNIGLKPDITNDYCGGLIGYIERYEYNDQTVNNTMLSNIKSCFNGIVTQNPNDNPLSIGGNEDVSYPFDITDSALTVSKSNLKNKNTFTNWDFDLIWEMDDYFSFTNANYEYPKIRLSYKRQSDNIVPKINNYQSLGIQNKKFTSIYAKEIYANKIDANVNFGKLYVESSDNIFLDGGTPSVGRILSTVSDENQYLSDFILNYFNSPTEKVQNLNDTTLTINDEEVKKLTNDTTINCANGNYAYFTLGANVSLTFNASLEQDEESVERVRILTLEITDGGAYTLTFTNTIKWPSGNAPSFSSSGTDIVRFLTRDGTTWFGFLIEKAFA